MSNYWIFSTTFEDWPKVREGKIWATKRALNERIKNGDYIALYVIGTNSICGTYQIDGEWYLSKEPYWSEEVREGRVKYPHQVKLRLIQEGVANMEKLTSSLTFIENKENWFVYFRGTPANFKRPISALDYEKILEEMKRNPLPTDVMDLLKRKEPVKGGVMAKPKHKVGEVVMHPKYGRIKIVSMSIRDGKWFYDVRKVPEEDG